MQTIVNYQDIDDKNLVLTIEVSNGCVATVTLDDIHEVNQISINIDLKDLKRIVDKLLL